MFKELALLMDINQFTQKNRFPKKWRVRRIKQIMQKKAMRRPSTTIINDTGLIMKMRISSAFTLLRPHDRSIKARFFGTLSDRLDGLDKPTVWHEFSPLAVKHGAINLGQGFPDWQPPGFATSAFKTALDGNNNQYARSAAHMKLAKVLSEKYAKRLNRSIDPETMVATACGCTNALYCALQGLLNKGDEVVLIEPAFDIYHAQVAMAGGKAKFVPLRPNEGATNADEYYSLDMEELEVSC